MAKKPKKFQRLPPAYPPAITHAMEELVKQENQSITNGDTAGLSVDQHYLAIRVLKEHKPVWVVMASPFRPQLLVGVETLFVASVTLAQAVYLVKAGAEVVQ